MSQTSPAADQDSGAARNDPYRPRFMGFWIGIVLAFVLGGGAAGVIADIVYRDLVRAGVLPPIPFS